MAKTTEPAGEPRKERLEALVRIEDKVEEAAEAAAEAAAHAVEATKAAEAASKARAAKRAAEAKAAKAANTAKSKAKKAARVAKAASTASLSDAPSSMEPTGPLQTPTHVVEVRLTDDELDQIERVAANEELSVPALARSLLVRALNRSRDSASPPGEPGRFDVDGN